jgi:transcriptional regulator with XRE-family HTH domain
VNDYRTLLRNARLDSGRTYRSVAKEIGKSIGYLSDLESGRKTAPLPRIAEKLERALGITGGSLTSAAARARELKHPLPTTIERLERELAVAEAEVCRLREEVNGYSQILERIQSRCGHEVWEPIPATPYAQCGLCEKLD